MKYATELVLKVNEVYHDVEESEYKNKHPEIFKDEVIRWQKIGKLFIANNSKKKCLLDIGSGTGFVPLQIGGFLKKGDLFVCSDISDNILNVCKKDVLEKEFKCDFEFVKLDGKRINLESNVFDYITLNSVLHHIPNFSTLFKEINRLLKTNGRLIIGHEPNKPFYTHKFLWNNYRFISVILNPKQFVRKIYQRFNQGAKPDNRIVEGVNRRILEDDIIKSPLTAKQIAEILDIHVPTAGRYRKDRGIDISEILKGHLPNFEVEHLETYNHLCEIRSHKNKFTEWYDSVLKKIYPKTGATFLVVLKKVAPIQKTHDH